MHILLRKIEPFRQGEKGRAGKCCQNEMIICQREADVPVASRRFEILSVFKGTKAHLNNRRNLLLISLKLLRLQCSRQPNFAKETNSCHSKNYLRTNNMKLFLFYFM